MPNKPKYGITRYKRYRYQWLSEKRVRLISETFYLAGWYVMDLHSGLAHPAPIVHCKTPMWARELRDILNREET